MSSEPASMEPTVPEVRNQWFAKTSILILNTQLLVNSLVMFHVVMLGSILGKSTTLKIPKGQHWCLKYHQVYPMNSATIDHPDELQMFSALMTSNEHFKLQDYFVISNFNS